MSAPAEAPCKHTQWTNAIDGETVSELIGSCDAFRASLQITGFTFKPVLVTNSGVARSVRDSAWSRDVEIVSSASFASYMSSFQCSRAEIESVEHERYPSLGRLKTDIVATLTNKASARVGL